MIGSSSTSWLGRIEYPQAEQIQRERHTAVLQGHPESVLGFETGPVITLGRLARGLVLECRRAPVIQTDRGGQVTLHSPGQLVIYPIWNLKKRSLGVRDFVEHLLQRTQLTFAKSGLKTDLGEDPGLYVDRKKIAFIGVRVDRGVSRHGISINLSNDLGFFDEIVPCGRPGARITSAAMEGVHIGPQKFFEMWCES